MRKIKNLVFDCDGVLYPISALETKEIIDSMKKVYREDLMVSGEEQNEISEATIADNHRGLFNYVLEMCRYKNYDFNHFCEKMADGIDYSRIQKDDLLWKNLQNVAKEYNVAILSNNSRPHIAKVLHQLFDKSIEDVENAGIKVFDITSTEKDGFFHPKQSENGLSIFAQHFGVNPQETLLFDDVALNIESAQKIGMQGNLINEQHPLKKALLPFLSGAVTKGKEYE